MGRDGFLLVRQLVTDISERTRNKEIWRDCSEDSDIGVDWSMFPLILGFQPFL
jgi:hypothetical protein